MLSIGGPILRMRNARQSEAASDVARVFKHEVGICGHGGHAHRRYLGGSGGECRLLEVPFCEMRNTKQSDAASRSARVSKHEVEVCGHGGYIYRANLGGPGGEHRRLEVPIRKYAMRGSPRPHPTLLVSLCTKWMHAVMVDMPIVGISEGPG